MSRLARQPRVWLVVALALGLVVALAVLALRSGPLAPVPVTAVAVVRQALQPVRFGLGNVEAQQVFRLGPTAPGRLLQVHVQVGDHVAAGQEVARIDPVDLEARVAVQQAALRRAQAVVAEAQARQTHAAAQARRYQSLLASRSVSEEVVALKRQELQLADAGLAAARAEVARVEAELVALEAQQANLVLLAPVAGLVVAREAESGSAVAGGQTVVEVVDPQRLWVAARFDQRQSGGLVPGLAASIVVRSQPERAFPGQVVRVEPKADAVTEELMVKVAFSGAEALRVALGEVAEVTVPLAPLPPALVIPAAAIQRQGQQLGVWQAHEGRAVFTPVALGQADLDGQVQVLQGLSEGASVIVYSQQGLAAYRRVTVVEHLPGVPG